MLFETAEKKLKRLAKKDYCSISYTRTYDEGKVIKQECCLYISHRNWYNASTWKQAFALLQEAIKPSPIPEDEAPTEEVDNENHN